MTCSGGFCTSGAACATDAGTDGATCGGIGEACCESDPPCNGNGYCSNGTCTGDCITDVGLGRRHTCMLRHDGTVWCAGQNDVGQLGIGSLGSASPMYVQATDASGPISDATAIGAGNNHTCAVRAGHVWCWGSNAYGQLGDNTVNTATKAVEVVTASLTPLENIVAVAAGTRDACAIDAAGALWCWGGNDGGQLGDGTMTTRGYAVQVATLTNVQSVSMGIDHVCALQANTTMSCWGYGYYGELGDGTGTMRLTPMPIGNATSVAAGGWTSCAVLANGEAQCWGRGDQERLGTGDESNAMSPVPVLSGALTGHLQRVVQIAVGGLSCAVTMDNQLLCWGVNPHGQIGNGGGSPFPVNVPLGAAGASHVYAHYAHVCARSTDGNLWCWGRNTEGELGDSTFVNVSVPQPVAPICR